MKKDLIAPCGMNCGICMAYLREKRKCPGCGTGKKECVRIYKCSRFRKNGYKFCYECNIFPCIKIKSLDKRYRTKYGMSMIENLEFIKKHGIGKFLKVQEEKYKCPECGGVICVHHKECFKCKKSV